MDGIRNNHFAITGSYNPAMSKNLTSVKKQDQAQAPAVRGDGVTLSGKSDAAVIDKKSFAAGKPAAKETGAAEHKADDYGSYMKDLADRVRYQPGDILSSSQIMGANFVGTVSGAIHNIPPNTMNGPGNIAKHGIVGLSGKTIAEPPQANNPRTLMME